MVEHSTGLREAEMISILDDLHNFTNDLQQYPRRDRGFITAEHTHRGASPGYVIEDGHVIELSLNPLTWQQVIQYIPSFTRLEALRISYMPILQIPEWVGTLTHLRVLILEKVDILTLPDTIGDLHELEELYISNSHLAIIPDSLTELPKLRVLDIKFSHVANLPENLGDMKSLEILRVVWCHLKNLPSSIRELTGLQELDVTHNQIVRLPDLSRMRRLYKVSFDENPVEAEWKRPLMRYEVVDDD
jgi:Leucine-rich repeat (LRR) protein